MPNNFIKKSFTLYAFHLPILLGLFALIAGSAYMVNNKVPAEKETPQVQGKKTENKTGSFKKIQTEVKLTGNSAQEHKKVSEEVIKDIKVVAKTEKTKGNVEVSEELTTIAEDQESVVDETVEIIEEVEKEPKWKVLLIGPDYKNLGQLRSTLAHNTNTIRKLTQTAEKLGIDGDVAIQENLALMNQERDRIMAVIQTSEGQFSLLGWVSKLLLGYSPATVEEEEVSDGLEGIGGSVPLGGFEEIGDTAPSAEETPEIDNTVTDPSAPGDYIQIGEPEPTE